MLRLVMITFLFGCELKALVRPIRYTAVREPSETALLQLSALLALEASARVAALDGAPRRAGASEPVAATVATQITKAPSLFVRLILLYRSRRSEACPSEEASPVEISHERDGVQTRPPTNSDFP